MTVAKEPGHRGEHEISRKTIACGNVGRFRCTRCYSCAFYHYKVHTRPRVQRAPGVPHALFGRRIKANTWAHHTAGSRIHVRNGRVRQSEGSPNASSFSPFKNFPLYLKHFMLGHPSSSHNVI